MPEFQKTIKKPVTVSGTGLHTGLAVNLTFNPAPENYGVKFQRTDLENSPIITVDPDNVIDTSRGTTMEQNGGRVYTSEHVLAALTGLGIDNCHIEIDKDETPIKDGSSKYFIEALTKAGVVEQKAERNYIKIDQEIVYKDEVNNTVLTIQPDDHYSIEVEVEYENTILTKQIAKMNHINEFKDEISICRTFVFLHELEFLLHNNLIKGGDLDNAIVFVNRDVSQDELDRLADIFKKPRMKVKEEGILNNLDLHFHNEPARHKLLDVVGDLSLLGRPILGKIIAKRPGHQSNVQFAKLIKKHINKL